LIQCKDPHRPRGHAARNNRKKEAAVPDTPTGHQDESLFARGADPSAWRDDCPNDDTHGALAPVAMAWARVYATAADTAIADDDRDGLRASALGLMFAALASLVLLGAPLAVLRGLLAPTFTPAASEPSTGPAVTCIDASCLSAQPGASGRSP
jgi:hypothetical protein